jgi:hypothetical protein
MGKMREREPEFSSEPSDKLQIHDLPTGSRPRERLLGLGAHALSSSELLSIVIGTGHEEHNALTLAPAMLETIGNGLAEGAPKTVHNLGRTEGQLRYPTGDRFRIKGRYSCHSLFTIVTTASAPFALISLAAVTP